MCRALRILCAASTSDRLLELKRQAISASWEVVGGATSVDDLVVQIEEWEPDVVVLDADLGAEAAGRARRARTTVRVVSIGPLAGADEECSLEEVREAILGLPRPGGPVRQ